MSAIIKQNVNLTLLIFVKNVALRLHQHKPELAVNVMRATLDNNIIIICISC